MKTLFSFERKQQLATFALCVALFSLFVTHISAATELIISQVGSDKRQFMPEQHEEITISYQLNGQAQVSLRWYDGRDIMIREQQSEHDLPAGTHEFTWDGKDQAGRPAPDEVYRYVLTAIGESGQQTVYDLTDSTFGKEVAVEQVRWDTLTRRIHYRIAEPARVSIRAGLSNNGPLLRTITDWLPRSAGDQVETWDGQDQSSVLDISTHPRLEIAASAFAIGDNAIIVGSSPSSVELITNTAWPQVQRVKAATASKRMYHHAQQPITARGDIEISLTLDGEWPTDDQGQPIVSGIVPVRLEVASADRQRALERRFEPVFFIDGAFTFENEVGFLPTTWLWDTRKASPGQHYINANLRGYEGNFGMATLPVTVVKEQAND